MLGISLGEETRCAYARGKGWRREAERTRMLPDGGGDVVWADMGHRVQSCNRSMEGSGSRSVKRTSATTRARTQ
jgi:hypothetical protein